MELTIVDHDFIFNMYELISIPNRHLIRQLLTYDCVTVPQVHFNLMKVFSALYHIPIEYSSLCYILNSLVTSYLMSVIDKTLSSTVLNHYLLGYPVNIEHDVAGIIMNGLHDSYVHNSLLRSCTESIKPLFSNIPIKVQVFKSENLKKSADKKENVPNDNDFKSFVLPLEQDYTKSSKGYSSQVSITNGIKNENSFDIISEDEDLQISNCSNYENIPEKCEINYQVQQNEFSQSSNALKNKPNNKVFDDPDIISSLQGFNNCTEQSPSQKNCLRNSHSQITFNYSLNVFADRIKQQLSCDTENNDSDSDNSIIFSGDSVEEINKTFILDSIMPINTSDNDNILSENVQINEGINISKFWDSKTRDSSSDDDEHSWDNDFDENASDLFKTLSLNFTSNFPTLSACLQNNTCTGNEPLNTYGYVNACFEDDEVFVSDHIKNVNNSWNSTMKDVSSEPRQAKRVSFVALPDLVSVYNFESDNDGYCYSVYVLNQLRFQDRIQEFEAVIEPFLTSDHREKIYRQNYQSET